MNPTRPSHDAGPGTGKETSSLGGPTPLAVLLALGLGMSCVPATQVAPRIDPTLFPEPAPNAITFWGHASIYIDVGGFGIVTDPVFEGSYSPFHPRSIPSPPPESYDQTDVVLLSHAHADHLHPGTLARFPAGTVVLCPEPSADLVKGLGLEVRVMRPGDTYVFPGGSIVAVPADHPGGRLSLAARLDGGALGYVIRTAGSTVYYSGDTEFFPGMAQIAARHDPDIAILNINAHLNSDDALRAVEALGRPTVVPSHFGAYGGSNARRSPEWRAELERGLRGEVVPLEVGESLALGRAIRRVAAAPRAAREVADPGEGGGGSRGAPGVTRTPDTRLGKPLLHPPELRGHEGLGISGYDFGHELPRKLVE